MRPSLRRISTLESIAEASSDSGESSVVEPVKHAMPRFSVAAPLLPPPRVSTHRKGEMDATQLLFARRQTTGGLITAQRPIRSQSVTPLNSWSINDMNHKRQDLHARKKEAVLPLKPSIKQAKIKQLKDRATIAPASRGTKRRQSPNSLPSYLRPTASSLAKKVKRRN